MIKYPFRRSRHHLTGRVLLAGDAQLVGDECTADRGCEIVEELAIRAKGSNEAHFVSR